MKTYLAWFTLYDGEHEHSGNFVVKADSLDEAADIAKTQMHYPGYLTDEDHRTYWDYGDGLTASKLDHVREITKQEADILDRLGVAFYFN